jgi:hypothetical protein
MSIRLYMYTLIGIPPEKQRDAVEFLLARCSPKDRQLVQQDIEQRSKLHPSLSKPGSLDESEGYGIGAIFRVCYDAIRFSRKYS